MLKKLISWMGSPNLECHCQSPEKGIRGLQPSQAKIDLVLRKLGLLNIEVVLLHCQCRVDTKF